MHGHFSWFFHDFGRSPPRSLFVQVWYHIVDVVDLAFDNLKPSFESLVLFIKWHFPNIITVLIIRFAFACNTPLIPMAKMTMKIVRRTASLAGEKQPSFSTLSTCSSMSVSSARSDVAPGPPGDGSDGRPRTVKIDGITEFYENHIYPKEQVPELWYSCKDIRSFRRNHCQNIQDECSQESKEESSWIEELQTYYQKTLKGKRTNKLVKNSIQKLLVNPMPCNAVGLEKYRCETYKKDKSQRRQDLYDAVNRLVNYRHYKDEVDPQELADTCKELTLPHRLFAEHVAKVAFYVSDEFAFGPELTIPQANTPSPSAA